MKMPALLIVAGLLAACSSPQGDAATTGPAATTAPATPAAATAPAARTASASGVVESVDVSARKVTIAHGPVEALEWPAMTMSFQAPDLDLAALKPGDRVTFEFTSSGMDGTITRIERQP